MILKQRTLRISKLMCRLGMLIVWAVAAANISLIILAYQKATEMLSSNGAMLSDVIGMLLGKSTDQGSSDIAQGAEVALLTTGIDIGISVTAAILATAVFATAIAAIDLRNIKAHRSRRQGG